MLNVPIHYGLGIHSVFLEYKPFSIANSSDLFHNLFRNEDRIEVTDEDILTEIHHLTMAVKAAQLDDYPESHSVS